MIDELKLLVKNTSKIDDILSKISTNNLKLLNFLIINELDTRKLDDIKFNNILNLEDICRQLECLRADISNRR